MTFQSTTKPSGCPNLNDPSLWYYPDGDIFYSGFTGDPTHFGVDLETASPISIWTSKPDGVGNGVWSELINYNASQLTAITRVAYGAQAFSLDSAWVLGGYSVGTADQIPGGMVQFDMSIEGFVNRTANVTNGGAQSDGALHYVPSFGPKGLYILMGGYSSVNQSAPLSFSTVVVFDPEQLQWFNQTTTGAPPSPKGAFCTAGINSTNHSYEMYVDQPNLFMAGLV